MSDFERAVYDAALKSFNQLDNPLRVNNYATALRELGRIHLEGQAPDERVKSVCGSSRSTTHLTSL